MLKIGVVIASAGGPAHMSGLFEAGCAEDAVWLILQRHADAPALARLAAALEEMTGRKVNLAKEAVALHGGEIWVLLPDVEYVLSGNRLVPQKEKGPLHLDRFFLNLGDAKAALAVVLLTGPWLEGQGGTGLKSLGRTGARLFAIDGVGGPAQIALEKFFAQPECEGLNITQLPPKGALAKVKFGKPIAEAMRN